MTVTACDNLTQSNNPAQARELRQKGCGLRPPFPCLTCDNATLRYDTLRDGITNGDIPLWLQTVTCTHRVTITLGGR